MSWSSRTPRRDFRLLWFAQSILLVGLQAGSVAVPLLAVDVLRADASQVALIGALSSLPWLIAPVIGVLADRVDRKRLLLVSHLGRALLWLTVPAAYLLGILTMHQLWLVAVSVGVLGVVFGVGYRTFLPTIVPRVELGSANGKLGGTDAAARAVGPAVAGLLIQLVGPVWTVLVQAVTSWLAGGSTAAIRPGPGPRSLSPTGPRSGRLAEWWHGVGAGFRGVYRIKALRWLTLGDTAYLFFFDVCFALLIIFLRIDLGLSAVMIGVIFSVGSVGGILGATVAHRLGARVGLDLTVRVAAVLRGVGLALLPLSLLVPGPAVIVVLIAGRGINACAWSVYEVLTETYQQTALPDRRRGSAIAAILWLGSGASTIGAGVAAVLSTMIDTAALITVAGIGATTAGLISLRANLTTAADGDTGP